MLEMLHDPRVAGVKNSYKNGSVSVPNITWTTVHTMALNPGAWLVIGHAKFAANSTGTRHLAITKADENPAESNPSWVTVPAASGSGMYIRLQCVYTAELTAAGTVYLKANQNSGAALDVLGYRYLRAIRLK